MAMKCMIDAEIISREPRAFDLDKLHMVTYNNGGNEREVCFFTAEYAAQECMHNRFPMQEARYYPPVETE